MPVIVGVIGILMLDEAFNDDDDDDEAEKARALVAARGRAIIGLGLSISVDELIVGFTIGYSQYFTTLEAIIAIVIQSFLALMAGLYFGRKVRDGKFRISVERVSTGTKLIAGGILVTLSAALLVGPPLATPRLPPLHPLRLPPQGQTRAGAHGGHHQPAGSRRIRRRRRSRAQGPDREPGGDRGQDRPGVPGRGLASAAVYAGADREAVHVRAADEALPLNGATPAETYLDMARCSGRRRTAARTRLHPGYGFLAESAEFAQAVLDTGLTWIGPPRSVIRRLGDKLSARQAAREAGVPLLPAMAGPAADAAQVAAFAREHGLPVVIKAAAGRRGEGQCAVARSAAEIPGACARAVRASAAANGQAECFAERYLDQARHIEVQCLADSHGGVAVVSTRDCSLQRRQQKIVEEAPAPFLPAGLDARLRAASAAILRAAGYAGRRRASSCSARTARSRSSRRTPG